MPTWLKYLLLQIPGCALVGVLLAGLWNLRLLTGTVALAAFAAWVMIDIVLYPLVKQAYANNAATGAAALVGARGVAQGELNPKGYVRVRGELWRALVLPADGKVASGTPVEIVKAEGMQVVVRPLNQESVRGDKNAPAGG